MFLGIEDMVKRTGLGHSTLRDFINAGDLPAYRFGRRVLVEEHAFEEFLKRHQHVNPAGKRGERKPRERQPA